MKVPSVICWAALNWAALLEARAGEREPGDLEPVEFEEELGGAPTWAFRERVDAEGSVLWADGITLSEHSLGGRFTSDALEFGFSVAYNTFDLDYEP